MVVIQSLGCNYLYAQTFNFNNYSLKDGLIQSNVNDILQDKEGYMWFATDGGLSKFSGQNFTNFSTNDGLSEASVNTICQDNQGVIWIGYSLGKISYYDGNIFHHFNLDLKEKPNRINDINKDTEGNLWISTIGSGVIKLNPKSKEYKIYSINEKLSDIVFSTYIDKDNKVWFITDLGIKYYNAINDSFIFFKPKGFPFFEYTSMTQDSWGNYWFGTTSQGIVNYQIKDSTSTVFGLSDGLKSNFITALISNNGSIWAATWEGGIVYIKDKEVISITDKNGLSGNKVRSLFIGRESILWAGIQDKGLAQFMGFKFIHYTLEDKLNNGVINCIIEDNNGKYWLGTNDGIDILTLKNNYFINNVKHLDLKSDLRNNLVTAFCKHENKIYVSTFKGDIGVYDAHSGKLVHTLSINHSLINDLSMIENELWIATSSGLTTYNIKTGEFKDKSELDKLIVLKIHKDSKGTVWIGTRESGIWYYSNKTINRYKGNVNHNSPTSFCNDFNGNLWIGTEGGGIYKKEGDKIINYNVKKGLISDYITLITCDSLNNIWIGTNMGLVKFNPEKNTFRNYSSNEGFTAIETKTNATYYDKSGSLWFGTVNGATLLNLHQQQEKVVPPILYLLNFEIFSTSYSLNQKSKFNHNENEISFHFIGLNFKNVSKIKYVYQLEGLDEKWNEEYGIKKVTYSHLPPGKYKFVIKACSSDDVCTEKPLEFSFEIIPPFYKRVWFIVLCSVALISLIAAYITFRTRYLRQAKISLEKQVKARTIEIEQKNSSLLEKNEEIVNKNKEITDSITYAKRIQEAILPSIRQFKKIFGNSFIFYKPKAIVSGDFYWYVDIKNKIKSSSDENDVYVAVADCTGHGVPGAFMCMIGNSLLNQIIQESDDFRPSKTLELLHIGIRDSLKQQENETRDGMDIALCHIHRKNKTIEFSGALRPLIIFRGNDYKKQFGINLGETFIEEIKADKFSIGGIQSEEKRTFTNHVIQFYEGDTIYLYTDGYVDQFGGENGKKLMSKKFKEMLGSIQDKSMEEQYKHIQLFFTQWQGTQEQLDDVLVMGIRF